VPVEALSDTTDWLLRPTAWEDNKGEPGFSDKKLARIQFSAALAEAFRTAAVDTRQTLIVAAETLLPDQSEDGSWKVDVSGALGSPATYGTTLATYMARRTLHTAAAERFRDAISRADAWLLAQTPRASVDAAALALAMADRLSTNEAAPKTAVGKKLREIAAWLLESQAGDGGWGPYPKSPSEAFDTAITLLALAAVRDLDTEHSAAVSERVHRGRGYLIATQLAAGGWPATTRPSGFQSYAQHASTSGWATLALLRTRPGSKP
jgi:squalene cyclase